MQIYFKKVDHLDVKKIAQSFIETNVRQNTSSWVSTIKVEILLRDLLIVAHSIFCFLLLLFYCFLVLVVLYEFKDNFIHILFLKLLFLSWLNS